MVPSASAITRSVLESKAMSASRRLVISAATRTPSLVLLKVRDRGRDLFLRIGGERLEIDGGLVRQRLLQMRHRRARRGAEQPEGGFRFDRKFDVGQPQGLLRLIEHRPAPDMHGGFAAESEQAFFLLGVDQQRDQQPVARCRDGGALDGDIDRAGTVFRKGAAGELRLHDLVDVGKRHIDRHADADAARGRRHDGDRRRERAIGFGLRRRDTGLGLDAERQRHRRRHRPAAAPRWRGSAAIPATAPAARRHWCPAAGSSGRPWPIASARSARTRDRCGFCAWTAAIWSATVLSISGLTCAGTLTRAPATERLVSPRSTCAARLGSTCQAAPSFGREVIDDVALDLRAGVERLDVHAADLLGDIAAEQAAERVADRARGLRRTASPWHSAFPSAASPATAHPGRRSR